MQLALKEAHIGVPLVVVRNGAEAIAYITRKGIYSKRSNYPLPRLMLLDLHMPGMDGFDVLEWLRRQPDLSGFRTVVLSASGLDSDRQRAAALGACDYKVKPNTFHELVQILQDIDEHWLHLCPRSFTQSTNPPGPGAAAGSAATAVTSTTSGIYASPAELKH